LEVAGGIEGRKGIEMNVSEITDERLQLAADRKGACEWEMFVTLAHAELSRRAAKVGPVVVEHEPDTLLSLGKPSPICKEACMGCDPKCGEVEPIHTEPELTPEELRECGMPETRSCENCDCSRPPAITPSDVRHCEFHGLVVHKTGTCASWKQRTPKPKPQTVGEGAIAIEPLCILDAPYDQYSISQIVASLNNERSRLNKVIDAVNQMREGK
jgi:hypothetical protein